MQPDQKLLDKLNEIRGVWGKPLTVTSGARCVAYNQSLRDRGIPAALHSNHTKGIAVDITTFKPSDLPFLKAVIASMADNLGIWIEDYNATPIWIHIQIVPYPSYTPGSTRFFKV
jgi:uncharacterized protein YcbK (DUF882 family)